MKIYLDAEEFRKNAVRLDCSSGSVKRMHKEELHPWVTRIGGKSTSGEKSQNPDKPANKDMLILEIPDSETIYRRTEFIGGTGAAEGSAVCRTYMERTLNFEDGTNITLRGTDSYFSFGFDEHPREFGKSGSQMMEISYAVQETWTYKERSLEQSRIIAALSGVVSVNGQTVGGSAAYAQQSMAYKSSTVSVTKGTVDYKNGKVGNYTETALSNREIYNKCAVFLGEAFGENTSDMVLSEKDFNSLFERAADDERKLSDNAVQKRQNLIDGLNRFFERNLAAVRKKSPACESLQVFEDTYMKLETYKYSEITALLEKMFSQNAIKL